MDFEEPINPIQAMNNEWDEWVPKIPALRFVGHAWDAVLVCAFGGVVYIVLTDGYGRGLGVGLQGLLFTVGGLVVWALLLVLFFRPVGRAAILKVAAVIRFVHRLGRSLFGSPAGPKE